MKTTTYIANRVELLKKAILKTIKAEPFNPIKELDHPRFHVDETFDLKAKKKAKVRYCFTCTLKKMTLFLFE